MNDPHEIDFKEAIATAGGAMFVGLVRFLFLLRRGRRFKWFDLVLEPCLAIMGGMMTWAICEATKTPDLLQVVMSQLGAWGGPRTIHVLELKYMGGSRAGDPPTKPGDLS